MPRRIKIALLVVVPIIFFAVMWFAGLRVNLTESYPLGIYRVGPLDEIQSGEMVLFSPPRSSVFLEARRRGYLKYGVYNGFAPLIKKIVAMPGDRIAVYGHGVFVNGALIVNSRPLAHDSQGRPLPVAMGGVVPQGFVWLMSDYNPRSFDARYFGLIGVERIVGGVAPVWVWG